MDLVPRIAREPFVRPFAGQRDLVALLMHLAREHQQGRARRVDDRAFRGPDQLWISVQHFAAAAIDDDLLAANVLGDLTCGFAPFVERRIILHGDREGRNRSLAFAASLGTRQGHDEAGIDAAGEIRHDRHIGPQPAFDRFLQTASNSSITGEYAFDPNRRKSRMLLVAGVGEIDFPVNLFFAS